MVAAILSHLNDRKPPSLSAHEPHPVIDPSRLGAIHRGCPAYPGGGGLGKPDIYCYFQTDSIVKPGQTGKGGSKNPDFRRKSLMDGPL